MQVIDRGKFLQCNFQEFLDQYWSKGQMGAGVLAGEADIVFRGRSDIIPRYRIPAADGKGEIFFNNETLLHRFANFPTPTQESFLRAARCAMKENEVLEIFVTVPWFDDGAGVRIHIRASGTGADGALDFEVMP